MKRAFWMLMSTVLIAGLSGCGCDRAFYTGSAGAPGLMQGSAKRCPDICRECRPCRRGPAMGEAFQPGPPTGSVTYPYYTLHGPRDFLVSDPPPIGP